MASTCVRVGRSLVYTNLAKYHTIKRYSAGINIYCLAGNLCVCCSDTPASGIRRRKKAGVRVGVVIAHVESSHRVVVGR
jgi:VanZ family protein